MIKTVKWIGLFVLLTLFSACQHHSFLTRKYTKGYFVSRHHRVNSNEGTGTSLAIAHANSSTLALMVEGDKEVSPAELVSKEALSDADSIFMKRGKPVGGKVLQLNPISVLIEDSNFQKRQIPLDEVNFILYDNKVVEYGSELKTNRSLKKGGWFRTLWNPETNFELFKVFALLGLIPVGILDITLLIVALIVDETLLIIITFLILIFFILGLLGLKKKTSPVLRFFSRLFYLIGTFLLITSLILIVSIFL